MKWVEIKVEFHAENKNLAVDLISDIFFDTGIQGVVIIDPENEPVEGWVAGAEEKPNENAVIGYFPKNDLIEKKTADLKKNLLKIKKILNAGFLLKFKEIDEENWANSWKKYFRPQKISNNLVVKPTWHKYNKKAKEMVIELDPGMAFGTGTHPTTFLCLNLIEKYIKSKDSVLDIGTGSGILLIAAAMLGAEKLFGIDIDEVATDITRQNLLLNHIKQKKFEVKTGSIESVKNCFFDMVVANILTDVIIDLIFDVKNILKKDGIFICSGIIEKKRGLILSKMNPDFKILEVRSKKDWVAITGKRL